MIRSLPPYKIGKQCIKLPNLHGSSWRYENAKDIEIILSFDTGIFADFYDKNGTNWLSIYGPKIIVKAKYQWNGCSPKKCIFGVWVGTPDNNNNIIASLFHDALVQFFKVPEMTLTKEQVDLIFYHIMDKREFIFACQYYYAVVKFGKYETSHQEYATIPRPA